MKYLIVAEKTKSGFSAYSPDLSGCVATGRTKKEVEKNMRDAIDFHIEGMREEGYKIPEPTSYSAYIEISACMVQITDHAPSTYKKPRTFKMAIKQSRKQSGYMY